MFRKVMIGLALLTTVSFSSSALGEVPDTFLGEWQVDIARTLLTHVKEMAEISPEIAGGMQVAPGNRRCLICTKTCPIG